MIVTEQQPRQGSIDFQQMRMLAASFERQGDRSTANKVLDILQKVESEQLNIGFCGHFSAGKSTMINAFLENDLLPSSPIPTSANLVLVRYGSPEAQITMTSGEQRTIDVEQIEQWKQYCKDGEQVARVTIRSECPFLEDGLQLLDTPGIDSTDMAHQAATEAALHLADVIVFVTDYNHVQSEGNFEFIKALKEKGKTLILVVNQIDKHREQELTHREFQQKLHEGLKAWGIDVDALLCTSLKHPEHPLNQFQDLKQVLQQVKQKKDIFIQQHLQHSLKQLWREHGQYLLEQQSEHFQRMEDEIDALKQQCAWEEEPTFLTDFQTSEAKLEQWNTELDEDILKVIEHAILTPYQTIQYAQAFIDSQQEDFKIGVLFSKKKTEEERHRRVEQFYADLCKQMETQLEWHIKEAIKKKARAFDIHDNAYLADVSEFKVTFPKERLVQTVKKGTVADNYVYTYATELKKQIQQLYRQHALLLVEKGAEILKRIHEQKYSAEQERLKAYKQIEALEKEIKEKQTSISEQVEKEIEALASRTITNSAKTEVAELFAASLSHDHPHVEHNVKVDDPSHTNIEPFKVGPLEPDSASISKENQHHGQVSVHRTTEVQQDHRWSERIQLNTDRILEMSHTLRKASDCLANIPYLATTVQDFRERAERLEQHRFTVCLFGAFSAGKSSFINALLGEQLLPVSPNPTTAAINQLLPPDEEHGAGTATVTMKSRETSEEQILLALKRLQLSTDGDIGKCLKQVEKIDPAQLRSSLKSYYTFLCACYKGWDQAQQHLGKQITVSLSDFSTYVAEERIACFVDQIQLYVDHPLLQKGIEIIDTPGADSIYSRHTNVTFEYVKHADVILYVTYYNHAFSKADRQFLDQLGRVKDQFALDKMFFLVNAADLAQSSDEVDQVVDHVEQELLQSGIRFPRIYPVSSIRVLEGQNDKGFATFSTAFSQFLERDLSELLTDRAQQDVKKGYALLEGMIQDLSASVGEKKRKIEALQALEENLHFAVDQAVYTAYDQEIQNEMKEHNFYMKQRLFHHFSAHMHEAFHPSVFQGQGNVKNQLRGCYNELWHQVSDQLTDELKATGLRMERFIEKGLRSIVQEWTNKLEDHQLNLGQFQIECSLPQPSIPEALQPIEEKVEQTCNKLFKSAKAFFEGDGKKRMQDALEPHLKDRVDDFLALANTNMVRFYQEGWKQLSDQYKQKIKEEIHTLISSKLHALQNAHHVQDITILKEQYERLL